MKSSPISSFTVRRTNLGHWFPFQKLLFCSFAANCYFATTKLNICTSFEVQL